uniref:Uncharacterized protein n=1 Tax=Glossina austeni TaxID=7395 RepID=A0A1A9V6U9_GLOAU
MFYDWRIKTEDESLSHCTSRYCWSVKRNIVSQDRSTYRHGLQVILTVTTLLLLSLLLLLECLELGFAIIYPVTNQVQKTACTFNRNKYHCGVKEFHHFPVVDKVITVPLMRVGVHSRLLKYQIRVESSLILYSARNKLLITVYIGPKYYHLSYEQNHKSSHKKIKIFIGKSSTTTTTTTTTSTTTTTTTHDYTIQ